jgi:hypothetical protein
MNAMRTLGIRWTLIVMAVFACLLTPVSGILAHWNDGGIALSQETKTATSPDNTSGSDTEKLRDLANDYPNDDVDMSASEAIRFYGQMDPSSPVPGPLRRLIKEHPALRERLGFRPMLQWYFWANRPKPFFPCLVLIFVFGVIVSCAAPGILKAAESQIRQRFWMSLVAGGVILAIGLCVVRIAILSYFGWPMGIVVSGLMQFALMCGVGAFTSLIGQTLGYYLRVDKWPLFANRPDARVFVHLLLGAVLCALLLQIPGFGLLPRIGTRLVGLLAVLGLGSLYRARWMAQQKTSIS